MLITIKNKDTLTIDNFIFRCSVGKNGIIKNKREGDKATPKGLFSISKLYYRADRVNKPQTKISTKVITKKMGWCDNPTSCHYNKEFEITKKLKHEKLFKKDNSYNYFIVIDYNTKKKIPFKGSAIFIHLTENYKKTAGCIALRKKDFIILTKLINKKTKIKIC